MKYSELFFLSSFSQSNIYNFTFFPNYDNDDSDDDEFCNYVMIFYLKPTFTSETIIKQHCDLISIESNNDSIHATIKPLDFPELSVTAEAVSIDSYVDKNTLSIILCLIKKESKPKSMVHIYDTNLKSENNQNKMEKFKPNLVFKKDIGFNPLHSTHTKYWNTLHDKLSVAFVLSISDECLSHSQKDKMSPFLLAFIKQNYQEQAEIDLQSPPSSRSNVVIDSDSIDFFKDKKNVRRSAFMEKNVRKRSEMDDIENRFEESVPFQRKYFECHNYNSNFPEFGLVKQKILFMNFKINEDSCQRISSFGSDTGRFFFTVVNMKKSEILMHFDGEHNSPITSLHLINDTQFNEAPTPVDTEDKVDYHLLVCSAVEQSVIYKNIIKCLGFSQNNQFALADSELYDCVLCSSVVDVDMDGECEVIIGTFQQYLLIYKWLPRELNIKGHFKLMAKFKCAGAIHAILHADVTRDGIKELIVLTTRGLHIYQLQTEYVQSILLKRLSI